MSWRVAKSLVKLRDQINEAHPNRNKGADGTIGDDAHKAQGSASDHNAWFNDKDGMGVVTALDITHDVPNGVDIDKLSDELIASRDPRIKYVIANGLIAGPYTNWKWLANSGHYNHIHISVNTNNYDDNQEWKIGEDDIMDARMADNVWLGLFGEHIPKDKQKQWVGKKMDDMVTAERATAKWKARDRAAKGLMDDKGQVDAVILNSFGRHFLDDELKKYKGKNWHKTLDELRETDEFKTAKGAPVEFEKITLPTELYKRKK